MTVKVAMISTNLAINGISNVIMNYCNNIDLNKFEITIFAGGPIDKTYKKQCDKLGIKIVELPMRKPTTFQYYFNLIKNFKKGYYDILHIHGNSTAMYLELFIGKIKKVKIKIAHCHNAKCTNPLVNKIFWKRFQKHYDYGLSCSIDAGNWVFSKNFEVLENGFNTEKFLFDPKEREIIRKKLGLDDQKIVIGHTGRFNDQKNQEFLIDIFDSICEKNNNIYLLLVGGGPNLNAVKSKIDMLKYKKNVILYGEISETSKIYSAMDVFAFPSKFEGLGLSLLEAQISGLNCIASDQVPQEAMITENVNFISLEDRENWIDTLTLLCDNSSRKKIDEDDPRIQKFNIKNCAKKLEKIYLALLEDKGGK